MTSTDDESLVGLTGGPLHNDDSEGLKQENGSKPRQKDLIDKLTERVTSRYDFKTFADTKEIYWYDNKLDIYRSNGESIIEALVESAKPNISTHEALPENLRHYLDAVFQ